APVGADEPRRVAAGRPRRHHSELRRREDRLRVRVHVFSRRERERRDAADGVARHAVLREDRLHVRPGRGRHRLLGRRRGGRPERVRGREGGPAYGDPDRQTLHAPNYDYVRSTTSSAVPAPGLETSENPPSMLFARARMFFRPWPAATSSTSKPAPSSRIVTNRSPNGRWPI